MAKRNPLDDGEPQTREDRSKWSLKEHCDYANAQMILKEVPEYRRKKGLAPVHWVIRDGRVVLEPKTTTISST